ncbi:STAS domain-containing protein [Hymenobacter lutimineralis]|uniref:Anti-sigma factor antagonist n=1 Tax=Hymenobacter lutimineralis TaxID=2606448 RepID=A0A5D6UQG3_9BACT|nr:MULTISPECIES: STAS domain-containing protein [Hymenobacter]QIX60608.1 STAS domain-containing protein [Hymenobacter sp. BT18]TYZ05447.1 STAS domain-containing protein [Hymenobacter lutimineralis]
MKTEAAVQNGILYVRLAGDLIGSPDSQQLLHTVNTQLGEDVMLCAIDLSSVRFINSTGIGVLVSILTKFRNQGGELVLINPSDHIRKLLVITKLNAIFTIAANDTEAAEHLKAIR